MVMPLVFLLALATDIALDEVDEELTKQDKEKNECQDDDDTKKVQAPRKVLPGGWQRDADAGLALELPRDFTDGRGRENRVRPMSQTRTTAT